MVCELLRLNQMGAWGQITPRLEQFALGSRPSGTRLVQRAYPYGGADSGKARRAGLGRESLYKALSPNGNPELATVLKVMEALGLRLHAKALSPNGNPELATVLKVMEALGLRLHAKAG